MSSQRYAMSTTIRSSELVAGKYRVLRELGRGGMGRVVEVEHIELGRTFALKLPFVHSADEATIARFQREVLLLARLRSPRIAQITDTGRDPVHGPFYVMEFASGETLAACIARGRLSPTIALDYAHCIALALADVHRGGVLHRDIKPSNIVLTSDADIPLRLVDFGLAAGVDTASFERVTRSLELVGSLPYLAPERLDDQPASVQSDLWALGVVLYEMIAGNLPFRADTAAGAIHRIANTPTPAIQGGCPLPVQQILDRLLSKQPASRYASADELAAQLLQARRALDERSFSRWQPSRAPARQFGRAYALGAAAIVSLFALGALGWIATQRAPRMIVSRQIAKASSVSAPTGRPLEVARPVGTTEPVSAPVAEAAPTRSRPSKTRPPHGVRTTPTGKVAPTEQTERWNGDVVVRWE